MTDEEIEDGIQRIWASILKPGEVGITYHVLDMRFMALVESLGFSEIDQDNAYGFFVKTTNHKEEIELIPYTYWEWKAYEAVMKALQERKTLQ